jgi:ABC-type spermidine/putrescine transport system permease subunit I
MIAEQTDVGQRRIALLITPALVLVGALLIVPLLFTLTLSVYTHVPGKMFTEALTLENYQRVLDSFYIGVFLNSLKISLIVNLVTALLGYPIAYFLARHRSRWRTLFLFMVIMPLMVGVMDRTYGWIILLGTEGIVNKILLFLHIISEPVRILYTEVAVVVGVAEVLLPFMVLPLLSSIQKVDPALEEAATMLGTHPLYTFVKVVFPLSLPGLLSGSLLVFSLSMGALSTPLFLGGPKNQMIAVVIWQQMLTTFNWPFASAIAAILVVLSFIIVTLYLKVLQGPSSVR